jgi:tetratricopeptide (TPR) repeat protein
MLRHLADKSFVMHLPGGGYLVHTLLRQFGLEKLYKQPIFSQKVHQHYSTYYLNLLGGWQAGLQGPSQNDTLAEMDGKINDLRPAWDWAAGNQELTCLARGLEGLCSYYELRARFREGQSACQFAVQGLLNDSSPQAVFLRAHLLAWESRFYRLLGEYLLARQRRDDSQLLVNHLIMSGQDGLKVQALIHLEAGEAVFTADLPAAQMHLERSLAAYRLLSDAWHTAGVLVRLGSNRGHAGDYFASEPLLLEALDLYQKLGSLTGCALAQRVIAVNQMRMGKAEALGLMRQVLAVSQSAGNREQFVTDARTLSATLLYNGQYDEIYPLLMQTLPIAQDLGNRYEIAFTQLMLGQYGVITAQFDLAHRYLGPALDLARHDGFLRETAASLYWTGCSTMVEKSPTQARPFFQECLQLYRKIGYVDELSWSLSLDACCQILSGEGEQTRQQLLEALEIALSTRAYAAALYALIAGALWLGSQGEAEKAVEYFALLMQRPLLARSAWFHDLFGKSIQAYANSLQAEIAAAAQTRGAQRQLWQAVGELHQLFVRLAEMPAENPE